MRKVPTQQIGLEEAINFAINNAISIALEDLISKKRIELEIEGKEFTEKDEYFSQAEACKFLKIHASTIIRWRKQKLIPYHRIGKAIMYSKHELMRAANPDKEK